MPRVVSCAVALGIFAATHLFVRPACGQTYVFSTLAGSPDKRDYVDEVGTAARFYAPIGVAVDVTGTLFVADGFDNYAGDGESPGSTIRKITRDGVVTTLAGSPSSVGNVDGTGSAARFRGPSGVAVDSNGNLYVADTWNSKIRKVTPTGVVTTLAGPGGVSLPYGVAVDSTGNVFFTANQAIWKITPDGVTTIVAGSPGSIGSANGTGTEARFTSPSGLAVDTSGNLFVAEYHNQTLRKITLVGVVTTLAGSPGILGNLDGTGSAARLGWPDGVAVDRNGDVFVADSSGVRKVTPDGVVTTVSRSIPSGTGGITFPVGIAVDASGNLYITDSSGTLRKGVAFLGVLPAIATQPQSQTAARGRIAVFNTTAGGSPMLSYQWTRGGTVIAGATDATLLLTNVTAASAGSYQCIVTNAGGSAMSNSAILTVVDAIDAGRFSNFSVRASVIAGRSIIAGFVVEGPRQKNVLIRGIGPMLAQFGVGGVLADPAVTVTNSTSQRIAENDNWPATLASVFASIGAFALPAGSKDAAVLLPLQPGSYTVALSGVDSGGGEGLIEIYELP